MRWMRFLLVAVLSTSSCGLGEEELAEADMIAETVQISALVSDGSHLYWTDHGHGSLEAETFDGRLYRMPLQGGEPEMLASDLDWPVDLVVDRTHVYWVNSGGISVIPQRPGSLQRIPKEGGEPEILARELDQPNSLVLDDSHVFVAENEGGRIVRVKKDGESTLEPVLGEAVEPVVVEREGPSGLRLHDGKLLWHEQNIEDQEYARQIFVADADVASNAESVGAPFKESIIELGWVAGVPFAHLIDLEDATALDRVVLLDTSTGSVDTVSSSDVDSVAVDGDKLIWVQDATLLDGATLVEYDMAGQTRSETRIGDSSVGPLTVTADTIYWHISGRLFARAR